MPYLKIFERRFFIFVFRWGSEKVEVSERPIRHRNWKVSSLSLWLSSIGPTDLSGSIFKLLMFFLGIVKPRTTSSNLKSSKTRAHQDNDNHEMVAHSANSPTEPTKCVQEVGTQTLDSGYTAEWNLRFVNTREAKRIELNIYIASRWFYSSKKWLLCWNASYNNINVIVLMMHCFIQSFSLCDQHIAILVDVFVYPGNQEIPYASSFISSYCGTWPISDEPAFRNALYEDIFEGMELPQTKLFVKFWYLLKMWSEIFSFVNKMSFENSVF